MTKQEIISALQAAQAAPFQAQRASGCGRAYVCISDKALARTVAAACKTLGLKYLPEAYGVGKRCIYLGYDNCSGQMLGKAEAFAKVLRERGIECFADAAAD